MTETAVVIGTGPGLGAALVRRLLAESFRVVAVARDAGKLRSVLADVLEDPSAALRVQACDAADEAQVHTLFDQIDRDVGTPDLVVYNVGTLQRGHVTELDAAAFADAWRNICLGGFLAGQAAARRMIAAGRGTLVFTGATSALRGKAGFAASAAARAGLRALAQSMARELGPQGVHVAHVIIDGGIYRPEYEPRLAGRPPDSLLAPDAIADAFLALHRQHRSAWTQELDLRPWVENF